MCEKAEFCSSEYAHTYFRSNNSSAIILSLEEKTKAWTRPMVSGTEHHDNPSASTRKRGENF